MALYGNSILLEAPFVTFDLHIQRHLEEMIWFNHWCSRMQEPKIPETYSFIFDHEISSGKPNYSVGWIAVGEEPDACPECGERHS